MSNLWFMPATPFYQMEVQRGLQYHVLNSVGDSLDGILSKWGECLVASNGGGIGTYWGNVRSIEGKKMDKLQV